MIPYTNEDFKVLKDMIEASGINHTYLCEIIQKTENIFLLYQELERMTTSYSLTPYYVYRWRIYFNLIFKDSFEDLPLKLNEKMPSVLGSGEIKDVPDEATSLIVAWRLKIGK